MLSNIHRLAITSGEPAGIGPELCIQIAQREWPHELVVLADRRVLAERAQELGLKIDFLAYEPSASPAPHRRGTLTLLDVPTRAAVQAGKLDPTNARYVLDLLDRACDGCVGGEFAAMVTAPVQKSVIADAGVPFSGHTEYLAERTHSPLPVMMLVADTLRVALATTHLPLKEVSRAITPALLKQIIPILHDDLRSKFGLSAPRILVLGLNPHAGESGHLGMEETEVITPVLDELRARGLTLVGPAPADTAFTPRMLAHADAVLAMYHDQGLPVLKYAGFGHAVNVTLGLPIVRTSVDHGTALDLAGRGVADPGSLMAATELAISLADSAAHA